MPHGPSSSPLIRRQLGRRLTALRVAAGLTQEQVAEAIERARATIGRMEDGVESVRYRQSDLKAMLKLYNASEEDTQLILGLAAETRNGNRKSWWHDYTESALPSWFRFYVTLETSAERIRLYETELVPGLLQTRAYAEQVTRTPEGYLDEKDVEERVNIRMSRQSLLTQPRAPQLHVILNEAVLHRKVGDDAVMAEQLEHLLKVSERANVILRVLPFDAGAHGGLAAGGPFHILDFPDDPTTGEPLEPPLAYVETLTGAFYMSKHEEVSAFRLVWDDLERRALGQPGSMEKIADTLKGLQK